MEQENRVEPLHFAVDLTKEEYLEFYRALARYTSARTMNTITIVLVALVAGTFLVPTFLEEGYGGLFRLETLYAVIPCALLLLFQFAVMPAVRRRQALRSYEAAIAGGHVFAGTVTVNRTGITKVTVSNSCKLSFSDPVLFHEQADMQVFVNPRGTSIVLPARCMTPEQAKAVRDIAFAALPAQMCKVVQPIVCTRTQPMEAVEETPCDTLFSADVWYNETEIRYIAKETSRRSLKNAVIPSALAGFVLALFLYDGSFLKVAVAFWGVIAVGLISTALVGRSRTKRMLRDENFRFTFKVTEKAVIADGGARRGVGVLPFRMMKHAVESDQYIEFYNRAQYICIPKRFITDIDSFRSVIDNCRKDV